MNVVGTRLGGFQLALFGCKAYGWLGVRSGGRHGGKCESKTWMREAKSQIIASNVPLGLGLLPYPQTASPRHLAVHIHQWRKTSAEEEPCTVRIQPYAHTNNGAVNGGRQRRSRRLGWG